MPLKVDPSPHNFNSLPLLLLLLFLFLLLPHNPCIVNSNSFIISIVKINVCADPLFFCGLGPFGHWGRDPGPQLKPWPLGPKFHGVGPKIGKYIQFFFPLKKTPAGALRGYREHQFVFVGEFNTFLKKKY